MAPLGNGRRRTPGRRREEVAAAAVRRSARKRLRHPVLGLLEFDCEVLGAPEHDQRLVIHVAPEGSVTEQRLALLATADEAAGRMPEPWTLVPVSPSSE